MRRRNLRIYVLAVGLATFVSASPPTRRIEAGLDDFATATLARGRIATVLAERRLPDRLAADSIALFGATAIAVDDQRDAIYAIDKARHMVFRFERATNTMVPLGGAQAAGFNGDRHSARETLFHVPSALALDGASGDVLVADTQNHRIRVISHATGTVSTVAGSGIRGVQDDNLPTIFPATEGFTRAHYSGDGGEATQAELNLPSGIAVDRGGVLFISDSGNQRIRAVNRTDVPVVVGSVKIAPSGIETIAGTGRFGFHGDNGPALRASFAFPTELRVDGDGNIYVLDTFNHRIRRIDRSTGSITTVATGLLAGLEPAAGLNVWKFSVAGFALHANGDIVYSDRAAHTIMRIGPDGNTERLLTDSWHDIGLGSIGVGKNGEVYVADVYYNRVLVLQEGSLRPLFGGARAVSETAAADAMFSILGPIAIATNGDIYLPDAMQYTIRRVKRSNARIDTVMGTGRLGIRGDGGPPEQAELVHPSAILLKPDHTMLIADQYANVVRTVTTGPAGTTVGTIAGNAGSSRMTEGGPATASRVGGPIAIARDPLTDELYIACQETHSIRKVDRSGNLVTVAGTGVAGSGGDGGLAIEAQFNWPASLAFDSAGVLYVSDMLNHRIRRISRDGLIDTIAGTGRPGFGGDGGSATEAMLDSPSQLIFSRSGDVFVADTNNHRVRRIEVRSPYRIDTVAGSGSRGFAGDGGPARSARLNLPRGIAFAEDDVLYIVDSFNRRVRAVRLASR